MAGQDGGYRLGVDLGTSNTVAVLRWPDGRTRTLLFDGQPVMPSGVFLDDAGRLHVGRDAERLAQADPSRYEPNPKRRVDEPQVLLGDREVPTPALLGALLRAVAAAAVEAVGFLPAAVLSYPAGWGARRREVLAAAVLQAGWPAVDAGAVSTGALSPAGGTGLVPEPVAAARYFSEVLRRPVPVGSAIAVFDFGGGTLDIAVVRNAGADPSGQVRFEVLGSGGVAELGGLDVDAALVEHMGSLIGSADPGTWQRLTQPGATTERRDRRQFWDEVRAAKEMLSRTTTAPVAVPGLNQALHLTRSELERLATPLLRRGVAETAAVIASCGLTPDQLAGLFLVGGSSRVPLVARLLHAELGIAPTVLEQPELPVAEGAAVGAAASPAAVGAGATTIGVGRATASVPVAGAPMSGVPASPAAAGAVPMSGVPASPAAGGYPPISGVPASPGPAGYPPVSPAAAAAGYPQPAAGADAPWTRWRRPALIGAGVFLALVGVVVAGVIFLRSRNTHPDLDFQAFADVGTTVPFKEGEDPDSSFVGLSGNRAYFAYQLADKQLQVAAVDAGKSKPNWDLPVPDATPDEWAGIVALPNAVVAFADAATDSEIRRMYALDPEDGHECWNILLRGDDVVRFFDHRVVVLDRTRRALVGYDMSTGEQQWHIDNLPDGQAELQVVATADDLDTPTDAGGSQLGPSRGADRQVVLYTADRQVRVVNVSDGTVAKSRPNVTDPANYSVAYEDKLYVASVDSNDNATGEGYRIDKYDLATLGEPVSVHSGSGDRKLVGMTSCDKERICLLETDKDDSDGKNTQLLAVDTDKRKAVWHSDAPGGRELVRVGDHVLVRHDGSDDTAAVFDSDGKKLASGDGVAVRLDGGNLLLFADDLSTTQDSPSVAGVHAGSKEQIQLGQLRDVIPSTCSWSKTVIGCATDSGFVLRRFVKQ